MRLYTFCNFYLSSIQQGIQPAHLVADMFVNYMGPIYVDSDPQRQVLLEWATHHKTMVCLNGGNAANLKTLWTQVQHLGLQLFLPCGMFCEDKDSLDETMTCIGIVVPEKIYQYNEYEREIRKPSVGPVADVYIVNPIQLNEKEKLLAALIASAPLAR